MTKTVMALIKEHIHKKQPGWCFTQSDFSNLGNYDAIRQALSRLNSIGFIHRLTKGIYYFPRYHDELGELPPSQEEIIKAVQRAYQIKCQPSGAYAANILGLSEQVPAKIVILTDGASKKITIGNREILFKKTTPKNMATADTVTGLIIQAFKFIGKDKVTKKHLSRLKQRLSKDDLNIIRKNSYLAPAWVAKLIKTELLGD